MVFNLKESIEQASKGTGIFTFKAGPITFGVELEFVSPGKFRDAYNSAKKIVFSNHQKEETIDERKIREFYTGIIKSWTLTYRELQKYFSQPMGTPDDLLDQVIECNHENKIVLMETIWGFQGFIADSVTEFSNMIRAGEDAERKNSGNSPNGG